MVVDELVRRGLDAGPLLQRHGLEAATLDHVLGRFPRQAILDFVAGANALAGDPALHVHAARAAKLGVFRFADYIGVMSPTVGLGLRAVMEGFGVVNEGVRWGVRDTPTSIVCELHAVAEPSPDPIEVACTFVVFEDRVRGMTHGEHGLEAIDLRAAEDVAGRAMRDALPETLFRFEQPVDRIVIARAAWDTTPLFSHPVVGAVVRAAASAPIVSEVRDWFSSVEDAIRSGLSRGAVAAPDIASQLGTSERSLQRRLQERGTSFLALLERVRQSEAFRLLRARTAREGIADIASRLGYSETSAFTRAFRRWTGRSPSDWASSDQTAAPGHKKAID